MIEKTIFLPDSGRLILYSVQGEIRVSKKLTDFLFLLILLDPAHTLDRTQLARFSSWASNLPLSAGKQVGRFIDQLHQYGLRPVTSLQKTNGWKLDQHWRDGLPPEIFAAAKEEIGRRIDAINLGTDYDVGQVLRWYRNNFEALVAMTTGRAQRGYDLLRVSMDATDDESLLAISNLLATRIEQRLESPRLPILPSIRPMDDAFLRAVEIRRTAAYALHARSSDWLDLEKSFKRQLAQLSGTGDFTTIAIVRNALGVLYRRMGQLNAAKDEIVQAAPLAIFSGDLILIQNIAFNLANIVSELDRLNPGSMPRDDFFALLQFDADLRQDMTLGRDSAQTELLLAYLHCECGEIEAANIALARASGIIADTGLPIDKALHARITGLLLAKRGCDLELAKSALKHAEQLFRTQGYERAANHVAREYKALDCDDSDDSP